MVIPALLIRNSAIKDYRIEAAHHACKYAGQGWCQNKNRTSRQLILAISKEDKIKISTSSEGGKTEEVEVNLLQILSASGLKMDTDYKLNMIEGHDRKDKCIQPLQLPDTNAD